MNYKKNKDEKYFKKIKKIDFSPIFILGLHRSGTSILYEMLNKTNCFNVVTAYHLIKFNELLHNHINKSEKQAKKALQDYFYKIGIGTREIDHMNVTPDFPEEYGFLLTNLHYPTKIKNNNFHIFEKLSKKIQFISKNEKPLLLKNPYDFSNFLFIKNKLPNAKFIFIHRNPINVINSKINAYRVLLNKKNPYTLLLSSSYELYFLFPLIQYFFKFYYSTKNPKHFLNLLKNDINEVNFFMNNLNKLKPNEYISIRYEDLCENPNKIISDILDFINCSSDIDFSKFIKPRKLKIPSDLNDKKDIVYKKMEKYCKNFNYC